LRELINATPSLRGLIIHAKDGQFQKNKIAELKEMLDARGGQGLILIEEGEFLLVSPGLMSRYGSGKRRE